MAKILTIDGQFYSNGKDAYQQGQDDQRAGKPMDDEKYLEPYQQLQYRKGWVSANYNHPQEQK